MDLRLMRVQANLTKRIVVVDCQAEDERTTRHAKLEMTAHDALRVACDIITAAVSVLVMD